MVVALPVSAKETVELAHVDKYEIQSKKPIKANESHQPLQEAKLVAEKPKSSQGSCEDAIAKTWPVHLQDGARLVAQKESGMVPGKVGPINEDGTVGNTDGSTDHGCFQVNSRWHKGFVDSGKWNDPYENAKYALSIYQGRGNWTAWYAVQGILW